MAHAAFLLRAMPVLHCAFESARPPGLHGVSADYGFRVKILLPGYGPHTVAKV